MVVGFPSIKREERIEKNWKRKGCNGTDFNVDGN